MSEPLASNVYKGKNSVFLAHGCISPYVGCGDILPSITGLNKSLLNGRNQEMCFW